MIKRIGDLRKDEFVRGSVILVIMIGIYNVFNYVFQISMARLLGPADYSILAVLMSIIYIFSIPNEAIQTVVAKYSSKLISNANRGKTKDLLMRSQWRGLGFASVLFLCFIPMAFLLSSFLNITFWLLMITGLFIFLVFTLPVTRGIIQGRKRFKELGLNLIAESLAKVGIALLLVIWGWKVFGAMIAVICSVLFAFLLSFIAISDILRVKRERGSFENVYKANMPILIAITSVVLMYSIDIIMARRLFPPQQAGEFAFVSLIGKVIIFVSSAVGKAMLPLSAQEYEQGNASSSLYKKSLCFVILIAAVALVAYFFFPREIITLVSLGSSQYAGAAGILFICGAGYSLLSIANIMLLYNLSINRVDKRSLGLLSLPVIQVLLTAVFHATLLQFSLSLLASSALLFFFTLYLTLSASPNVQKIKKPLS